MMAGSMAYKVQKLASSDTLDVQTASAAMGVRGTEFQVVYSPEGEFLSSATRERLPFRIEREKSAIPSREV